MNLTPGQAHEAYIGPPSEPIKVSDFLDEARELEDGSEGSPIPVFSQSAAALSEDIRSSWTSLPQDDREKIQRECRVDDFHNMLEDTIRNPQLMAYAKRMHDAAVHAIYETAEPTRKKRKRTMLTDPDSEVPETTALRLKHEAIKLKCWPLTIPAASFIRPPRQPDHNTLIDVKRMGTSQAKDNDALLFVTVYNRVSWGQKFLLRASQHVLLSSQSLSDLLDVIPCPSKEIPDIETLNEAGLVTGYQVREGADHMALDSALGAVVCIEGVLYGDDQGEVDYTEGVLKQLHSISEGKRPVLSKGGTMRNTKLSSLTVRLHEPYWIWHAGSCEHFFSVTTVRLRHPSDPPSGYPLTTQITPPLCDNCRVCAKVPAVYSIVGDVRLGESPFQICGPCWRWMGEPKDGSDVLVVPLPKYESGWVSNVA